MIYLPRIILCGNWLDQLELDILNWYKIGVVKVLDLNFDQRCVFFIGDKVTIKKGAYHGMSKIKSDVSGSVYAYDVNTRDEIIYCIGYVDRYGKDRYIWYNPLEGWRYEH